MSTLMTTLGAVIMATGLALLAIATARVVGVSRAASGRMWPYALAGVLTIGLGLLLYTGADASAQSTEADRRPCGAGHAEGAIRPVSSEFEA